MSLKSLFAGIANAEKSASAWFEQRWLEIHSDAPKITAIADKTLPYVSLLLETVLGATAGQPAATEAAKILAKAQSDLDVACALIYDTGATPTAASAITAVQSNLSGVLSATQVSNPASVATITKAIDELGVFAHALTAATVPVKTAA
jgi:hypothetical protein